MQNQQSVTEALRGQLFEVLEGLKTGTVSVEAAHAVAKISSNIISTVVVEIRAAEELGAHHLPSINGIGTNARPGIVNTGSGIVHRIK